MHPADLVFWLFKTQEAHDEAKNENSIMKELDIVRRNLKDAWKGNREKNSVDYYRFVVHPTDFGQTIENM